MQAEPVLTLSALLLPLAAPAFLAGCTASPPAPALREDAGARAAAPTSSVTLEDLALLQETALFTDEDVAALRASYELLAPRTDEILDVWYGFVASKPHLVRYFADAESGEPNPEYLAAVRERFEAWILETARAEYDQDWLDHQYEIALRHHSTKKNVTDGVDSVPIVHFRYLAALLYPVTHTLRPFLEAGDHSPEEVERMHEAWIKSVLVQVILWSEPFVREGEY